MNNKEDTNDEHGCCEIKLLRKIADALRNALFSEDKEGFDKGMNEAYDLLELYDFGPKEEDETLN